MPPRKCLSFFYVFCLYLRPLLEPPRLLLELELRLELLELLEELLLVPLERLLLLELLVRLLPLLLVPLLGRFVLPLFTRLLEPLLVPLGRL